MDWNQVKKNRYFKRDLYDMAYINQKKERTY